MFIPDPDLGFLPIPDPGVKKAPDPGSGSAKIPANMPFFKFFPPTYIYFNGLANIPFISHVKTGNSCCRVCL